MIFKKIGFDICLLRFYPCQYTSYSKCSPPTYKSKIFPISKFSSPSISSSGGGWIYLTRIIDSWKGPRIETMNIG